MIEIAVPCSTSNLGAGFDAIGIALGGLELKLRATPGGADLRIATLSGEGAAELPRDASNRILVAARAAAVRAGRDPAELRAQLDVQNSIPLQRGLGSSAAAALAGALLADALLGGVLGEAAVLDTAVALEGHPDNVLPALRGGAQVAVRDAKGGVLSCPLRIATPLRCALFIPDAPLATKAAREALPREVPLADAVFNLGRAALFAAALAAGRYELLGEAMDDRLHQPPRTRLMPWLPELIAAAREAGALGAALSGAGTTVFALCAQGRAQRVSEALAARAQRLSLPGRALDVDVAVAGATKR